MKYIFSLFIVLWSMVVWGQEGGFDPSNPQEPGQKYFLTVNVSPEGAGSVSSSGKNQYALGQEINLRAYANTNYRFVGWKQKETIVSDNSSLSFTIPAEHTVLTALFEYQPNNPDEPSPVPLQHKLILNTSPLEGGRFNITSGTLFKEGETINLQAYLNSGYEFEGWRQGEIITSTEGSYSLTMGTEEISLTGIFRFNPANPTNPGTNHWNVKTGEAIIDDFKPGNIMSAIDGVIGGSGNRSKVTMVIVSGQMNRSDFGIADYLSNCTLLDLSRTKGCVEIPDYAFDNTNLNSIILPATVERIGYRAFAGSKNLTDISCYAVMPPIVGNYAFENMNEGAVIHVLSSSISLYSEAGGWKDFTILPLTEEVRTLEINLPMGSEGLYKNMTLELVNVETGQKQRYVISDRLSYTFNGLLKNCTYNVYVKTPTGTILGQINNVEIENENKSVTFSSLLALLNVNLKVLTPDGTDVTSQIQITWLDTHQTYLSQGNQLKGQIATTLLNYRIVLNQNLGMQYVFPENQTYTVQEKDNQLVYTLAPIKKLTVNGLVKDVNGGTLSGAVVSISQKLNRKYSKSFTIQTDTKGKFELQVYDDESTISVSATDYISQTLTKDNFGEETELGTIALKSVTGATISLGFTYTTSVIESEAVNTQNWYSDYANVAYSIYNVTQGKGITEYSVQYPSIILLEEVSEGDQLRIIASSKNNSFVPVESTAVIDAVNRASVTFDVIGLGGINASFTSTDNVSVVGVLYNSKGELVKKYTYSNVSLSIVNLPDGVYTLVSMANSTFFNSILKLSQLAASGLTEGTDYVQNQITVKSGLIAKIVNDNIPVLDESKLYYTSNNTAFTVNKASIVAGNYLTLKGKVDFKSEYSGAVSDVRMVVDLPESCSFVDNSLMVGSKISSYMLDGNCLTIPLSNYADQIRFCIIPTEGGAYSPNAFVEFSLGGKTIQQPIGSAYYEVKDLSISAPKTVAKATLPISGTALGNSAIAIYDNDALIGQTTSLANGVWSTTCDLNKPYNLSTHNIYARVTTKQGLELQSETKEVMYDMNAIQVSTVTMNFYNGWLRNNIEVVFDLLNGTTNASSYMFYTTTDITFIIDFTNNSPDVVSNVTLYVFTDQNEVRPLTATYDEKKDKWIAVSEFSSNNLPINVSVDFLYNAEIALDNRCLSEQYQRFEDLYSDYSASKNLIDSISSKLKDEYREVTLDTERIALLRNLLVSSTGIVEQEPDNKVKEYLLGLSDQEFKDYLSDLYLSTDSLFEKTDSLVLNNVLDGSIYDLVESLENGQLLGNIKMSTCESISYDKIIADKNYIPLKTIDGNEIFMKCVGDTCAYIDFANNIYIHIYTNPDDQIVAYAQEKAMQNLKAKLEKLKSVLDNMKNVADKVNDYITKLIKIDQNGAMVYLNEREALHRAALYKMEQGGYVIDKEGYYFHQDRIDEILKKKSKLKNSINSMAKCQRYFTGVSSVFGFISTGYDCYDTANKYWTLYDKINRKDPCELHPEAPGMIKNDIHYYAKTMLVYCILNFSADLIALHGAWASTVAAVPSGGASLGGVALCLGKILFSFCTNQYIQKQNEEQQNRIKREIDNLKCDKGDNDDNNNGNNGDDGNNDRPNPTTPPVPPIHDPSGYVYETVESNRLQGVTATCYYKEMVEDMYGDMHENIVLWDAAEYAQKNPLFTDGMGMYAWDVPQGLWQVKFEKEGYQTTYSEWLPVPPPQLEVNIGMVQTTQPTVDAVRGYETGIEVDFSKFMQLATLTTEQVMVTRNGEVVVGEVIMLNEEAGPMDANLKFASKVRFIPVAPLAITDKVVLTISQRVKSYAGIGMENDYSQEIDIMKEAKSIVASNMEVIYNKTAKITVAVEPAEASVGKKITVVSASPMIATITPEEATLNEEGKATFTVTGELLGRTMLQFAVEGMNLKSEVQVSVVAAGKEDVSRSYHLSMGWNWLSVNVADQRLNDVVALLDPIKESVVTIKGQAGELTNDGQNGLQGSLTILQPEQAYKIKMKQDATLELKGKPVLAASTTITLNKGWNWIGYVPAEEMSLASALKNLVAEENDVIKGLDCFAVYNGATWIGSLSHLTQGEGYMYYSQSVKSFNYVDSKTGIDTQETSAQWEYNARQYADNMTVLARLYNGEQQAQVGKYLIGAFVNNECRGAAVEKDGYIFLTIHGERVAEQVTLRAFDIASEKEYTINEGLDFSETMKGTYASPINLHLGGELTGINSITAGLFVYPSPVRDRLYIRGEMEELEDIFIVNTTGQTCIVIDRLSAKGGIDVSSLSEGIYFVTVKSGKEMLRQKFVKIE